MLDLNKKTSNFFHSSAFLPSILFLFALLIYALYGFHGTLVRDDAIYAYSGQRMAAGIPPYVSIFDHKGPLSPILAGLGVVLGRIFQIDDLFAVRLVFFVISALSVSLVYLLGLHLFRSARIGIVCALTFAAFDGFASYAASGPQAKTPMVLFEILSLLLISQRRWFWAGLCGSLAFLTWQPAIILILVSIVVAFVQTKENRFLAVGKTMLGACVPIIVVFAYFLYKDSVNELLEGLVFFNITHLDRGPTTLLSHIKKPVAAVAWGYTTMLLPICVGLAMDLSLYFQDRTPGEYSVGDILQTRFSPILLSFPAPFLWSLIDFQWIADFYFFLPYAAIGFGKFVDFAAQGYSGKNTKGVNNCHRHFVFATIIFVLIGICIINSIKTGNNELLDQRRAAYEIETRFGRNMKLVSIGCPELLVLLRRSNPNPYVFIINGIDNRIDADYENGFKGWIKNLEYYDPDVIAFGTTEGKHTDTLVNWLEMKYKKEQVGPFMLYIKTSSRDMRESNKEMF